MERGQLKDRIGLGAQADLNLAFAAAIIEKALYYGVQEFVVCSGSRNSPLAGLLYHQSTLKVHSWPEERSAAFFAIGLARKHLAPVAIITTSGTAAAELLPAAMEAYYSGVPLLLITADRPKNYRGTGAPQSPDQPGLFGKYAPTAIDLEANDQWPEYGLVCSTNAPTHWNVCFHEPLPKQFPTLQFALKVPELVTGFKNETVEKALTTFFSKSEYPLAIVSTLPVPTRSIVLEFLRQAKIPVYVEAPSGLREESLLRPFRIPNEPCFRGAQNAGYPIDGVLRIGGVPTCRLWRDLETLEGKISLLSISHLPFTGLTWGDFVQTDYSSLKAFKGNPNPNGFSSWMAMENLRRESIDNLFSQYPKAEQSFVHALSKLIPENALVYLGNSLPIREWDLAADFSNPHSEVFASRGMNGIDGQISTFLGLSKKGGPNFGIFGDLTTLYDLAAPWILSEMNHEASLNKSGIHIIIINNGGGKIFKPMYSSPKFTNPNTLCFEGWAKMWGLSYAKWDGNIGDLADVIEVIPDAEETHQFNLQRVKEVNVE